LDDPTAPSGGLRRGRAARHRLSLASLGYTLLALGYGAWQLVQWPDLLASLFTGVASQLGVPGAEIIHSPVCLVHANGDAELDVVGLTGFQQKGPALILDGRTGAHLWSGGAYAVGSTLICPDTHSFVVNDAGSFAISLRRAELPDVERVRSLSDKPQGWAFGPGCVLVETADERSYGFDLQTGNDTPCQTRERPRWALELYNERFATERGRAWHALRGESHWKVWTRKPGTPLLSASASGPRSWSAELPYQNDHPTQVLGDRALVIIGFPIEADRRDAHVLGLDLNDGRLLYDRALTADGLYVTSLEATGGKVVLSDPAHGVWMLDASSGEIVWHNGL
jgi:hypothetical protein